MECTSTCAVSHEEKTEADGIIVELTDGEVYEYNNRRIGKSHAENMKQMAQTGGGLGTYISVVTRYGYARQAT